MPAFLLFLSLSRLLNPNVSIIRDTRIGAALAGFHFTSPSLCIGIFLKESNSVSPFSFIPEKRKAEKGEMGLNETIKAVAKE